MAFRTPQPENYEISADTLQSKTIRSLAIRGRVYATLSHQFLRKPGDHLPYCLCQDERVDNRIFQAPNQIFLRWPRF